MWKGRYRWKKLFRLSQEWARNENFGIDGVTPFYIFLKWLNRNRGTIPANTCLDFFRFDWWLEGVGSVHMSTKLSWWLRTNFCAFPWEQYSKIRWTSPSLIFSVMAPMSVTKLWWLPKYDMTFNSPNSDLKYSELLVELFLSILIATWLPLYVPWTTTPKAPAPRTVEPVSKNRLDYALVITLLNWSQWSFKTYRKRRQPLGSPAWCHTVEQRGYWYLWHLLSREVLPEGIHLFPLPSVQLFSAFA